MTRPERQALVRQIVAERLRGHPAPPTVATDAVSEVHPSHAVYVSIVNTGEACVIEPSAVCDHCGYCKSHGH